MRRRLGRALAELDIVSQDSPASSYSGSRPRIIRRQPRPGFYHPIGKQDVLQFLESIGPLAIYGLRSVELTRAPARAGARSFVFGRYEAPGRILLFEQPRPPWRLPGLLAKKNLERFERAGAVVSPMPQLGATAVNWPEDSLQRFMLEQVLLHELGHHVLQHHKAKRLARIARTRDHEAFASLFAERQKRALANRNSSTQ